MQNYFHEAYQVRTERRLDEVVRQKLQELLATVGTRTDRVQK